MFTLQISSYISIQVNWFDGTTPLKQGINISFPLGSTLEKVWVVCSKDMMIKVHILFSNALASYACQLRNMFIDWQIIRFHLNQFSLWIHFEQSNVTHRVSPRSVYMLQRSNKISLTKYLPRIVVCMFWFFLGVKIRCLLIYSAH
jgi:hypothetical protein